MGIKGAIRRKLSDLLLPEPERVAPYPQVDLVSWEPADGSRNFGDHLSRVIVAAVAGGHGYTLEDETSRAARMLAVGSILHFANDGDTIWGSGVNGKIPLEQITARKLDVRAVRGPKTARILRDRGIAVPDVYGDPALLIPRYFGERFKPMPTRDYVLVPNLHDLAKVKEEAHLVSPLWGWNRCIAEIMSARLVIASSLHGIIIAEAFGVPARFLRLSETEDLFKYDDYAQGTGRDTLKPARTIQEALDMGRHPPIEFDADALIRAFPVDLWG